jgi:hypothetical protein
MMSTKLMYFCFYSTLSAGVKADVHDFALCRPTMELAFIPAMNGQVFPLVLINFAPLSCARDSGFFCLMLPPG